MATLTTCIKKAGAALAPEDRDAILSAFNAATKAGTKPAEAARQAVDAQLAEVLKLLASLGDVRAGSITPEEVAAAYPAAEATDRPITPDQAANMQRGDIRGLREQVARLEVPVKDMEQYIKVAADSIADLRKTDVYRVLVESNRAEFRQDIATYIKANRPDLAREVDDVLAEQDDGQFPPAVTTPAEPAPEPPKPSAAENHAKDLGGRIAWQRGDLSLIEGFSLLSGDSVFVAGKGDNRTRVDIKSYTGGMFTDAEKAELLKARAEAVKADEAAQAANPEGPFAAGSMVFAEDIREDVQGVVKGWIDMLGLTGARIVVTTPTSGAKMAQGLAGRFRRIGKANLSGDNTNGVMQPLGGDDFHIAIRPGVSMLKTLEVLAHELGHIVERRAFSQAIPEVQAAIRAAHAKWLADNGKGSALKVAMSMRAMRSGRTTGFSEGMSAEDASAYWKSFSEWFADQVSRWATTQDKPASMVERFFKRLGAKLREFFSTQGQQFKPDATVAQWLDSLAPGTPVLAAPEEVAAAYPAAEAADRPKRPDGRTIPAAGDSVYTYGAGFGGMAASVSGEVKSGKNGLYVSITGASGMLGERAAQKRSDLTDDWTLTGEEHPRTRAERESQQKLDADSTERRATREAMLTDAAERNGTLDPAAVKVGDTLELADGSAGAVTEIEGGRIYADTAGDGAGRYIGNDMRGIRVVPKSSDAQGFVKVENFGEALPPGRRQAAASLNKDLTDSDIASRPLSEIWPQAENEAIEDPFAAAVAHAARAEVPAKPRKGYKLDRWVEKVKGVRNLAQMIVSGSVTREQFIERAKERTSLKGFMSKVALLEAIDRSQWKRIGAVAEYPDAIRYLDGGGQEKVPTVSVTVDDKHHWLNGSASVADHLDAINALLGVEPQGKRMEFEVRGRGSSWFINKKGDSEYRPLMTFTTSAEALKAKAEKYEELLAAWESVKQRDNVTERDTRSNENRERIGTDWRKGRDISAEEFGKTFGFKGGEFGKWVSQGAGAQERQWMLNRAYDALMDMAEIVGIPPRAVSLNGTLGIAFGSRGSGWASAHFEPKNLVINLTKTRGAGALGHEWFHALDNYFARMRRNGQESPFTGDQNKYRDENYITHRPEPMMVRKDRNRTYPALTLGQLEARREARKNKGATGWPPVDAYDADKWERDPATPEGVRPVVEERFADLVKVLSESPMAKRAASLDKGGGYWSRTLEIAARSFESYLLARMAEKGHQNDYLANVIKLSDFPRDASRYPYLTTEEVKPIAEAFGALFDTIQTREDEAGNMALFSRAPATQGTNPAALTAWAKETAANWIDAPSITVAATVADLPRAQLDQLRSMGAEGEVRALVLPDTGEVFLIANRLGSMQEAQEALFHEVYGHYGLRKFLGRQYESQMALLKIANPKLKAEAQAWLKANGRAEIAARVQRGMSQDAASREVGFLSIEEALSDRAGKAEPISGFKRLMASLQKALRKIGMGGMADRLEAMTEAETLKLLADARRAVRSGAPAAVAGSGMPAFSRAPQTDTPAFKAWFSDSKVVDADGKPLVVYHGTDADFTEFDPKSLGFTTEAHSARGGFFFASTPKMADFYPQYGLALLRESAGFVQSRRSGESIADYMARINATSLGGRAEAATEAYQIADKALTDAMLAEASKDEKALIKAVRTRALTAPQKEAVAAKIDALDLEAGYSDKDSDAESVAKSDGVDSAVEKFTSELKAKNEKDAASLGGKVGEAYRFWVEAKVKADFLQAELQEWSSRYEWSKQAQAGGNQDGETWGAKKDDPRPNIIPVYLSIKNPLTHDFGGKPYRDTPYAKLIDDAKAGGHDGLVLKNTADPTPGDVYVAFRPEQVKSAIGNAGTFDPSSPSILLSRTSAADTIGTTGEGEAQAIRRGYKARVNAALDRVDHVINGLGELPDTDQFLAQRYRALGKIANIDKVAGDIRSVFRKADAADKRAIYTYMTEAGASPDGIANAEVRAMAVTAKDYIGTVGDELVKRGLLSEESREEYRDRYLPRLYLSHLLDEGDWRAVGGGKKVSDLGYLKKRQDIPQEIRDVILGEVKDPAFLAATAIAKPMRDMALLDWLEQISANANWIYPKSLVKWQGKNVSAFWLKAEADSLRTRARLYPEEVNREKALAIAEQMEALAGEALEGLDLNNADFKQLPNTPRYGRLRGLLVRREIYDDLMGAQDFLPKDPGWAQKLLGYGGLGTKATQLWKMSKVALNIPGQIRNVVSNGVMLQLSGVPLHQLPILMARAIRQIRLGGTHWRIAQKYGVTESTFQAQEMFRARRDLLELERDVKGMTPWIALKSVGAFIADMAGDAYQAAEAMFKTVKIMDAMERQGLDEEAAALEAQKWLFDYSLLDRNLRYLRNAPVGAPFVTFSAKVLPRLAEVALLHPQRFLPWVALMYGTQMWAQAMFGGDDDEWDQLKKALPKWMQEKGHIAFLPFRDDAGRLQAADLSYFFPWSQWSELARNLAEGDLGGAFKNLGIFGGPVTEIITAMKTGKDSFSGRDIIEPGDPPARQAASVLAYTWDLAMPPMMSSNGVVSPLWLLGPEYGGKLAQASTGATNRNGDQKSTYGQAASRLVGLNVYGIDPAMTRKSNLAQMAADISKVRLRLRSKLGDQGLSAEQRQAIIEQYSAELQKRRTEMQKYAEESEPPAFAKKERVTQ